MRIKKWVPVAAALFLSAGPAFAMDWSSFRGGTGTKGDWEFGAFGGWSALDDYGGLRPESDVLFGARLGYFVSRHFSLEGSAQRTPSSTKTTSQDFNINSYRANAVMNLAVRNWFQPFLTGGGGYETTEAVSGNNPNTRTVNTSNFAWNVGAGARMFITPAVNVRLEGRYNMLSVDQLGGHEGNGEGMLGLSWLFGSRGEQMTPIGTVPESNMPPRITCVTDRSEVTAGQAVTITATASDPEGGPLTYDWSSNAGHVNGTGRSATVAFDGGTEPRTVTVTVRATDDHGNTSTSECDVRVVAAATPEEVQCLAGGFPRNLSRLTNVDKACLDDIVSRLRNDPRAHVVVIGHADTHETSAQRIGDQRASSVRDYLVTAGVDRTRITTRSMGSSNLLDTGTDAAAQGRNRRVVVWFVPEGAKEPH